MIFEIEFEVNIAPTMIFMGRYLFGFKTKDFNPTMGMKNLIEKFQFET